MAATIPVVREDPDFQTQNVLSIAWGHFTHDTYSAFVAPLLPLLIEKLSLSLTLVGTLTAISQLPAVLNPLIGYLADRVNVRWFIVLAPAATATFASLLGLMPTYSAAAVLLLAMGVSVAAFHAPAPAAIARIAGRSTGKGMSWFMAAGEMGRTLGPLLAVWAVSAWTLEGMWPVMLLGWAASGILLWRLQGVDVQPPKQESIRPILSRMGRVFLPLVFIVLFRNMLAVEVSTYMPTFLRQRGAALWLAGGALSILEAAGVVGALVSGPLSDRLGRRAVLGGAIGSAALLMLAFLRVQGWMIFPLLLALGFTTLSTQPVFLSLIQDHFPEHRAVANGTYMSVSFLLRSVALFLVGVLGDHLGLQNTYVIGAGVALLALPALWLLPPEKHAGEAK